MAVSRLILILLALPLSAQSRPSVAALIGAHSADVATSWGRREANPIIGDRFGWRGLAIKSATTGGLLYVQRRTGPRYRKVWTITNYVSAAVITSVAIRNHKTRLSNP